VALLHLTAAFPGLVYAPKRWATHDGVIPYRLLWAYARALPVARAAEKLGLAEGISLALAGEGGADAAQRTLEEAYPG
jgi:hypothetical protein